MTTTTLTLHTALLLAPLAAFAQNDEPRDLKKPEVANATKAAKRAWESAPEEKKALWQQQREALKHIDLSDETQRQIVIARGSPKPDEYNAHPTTAMLADNKTMFCVWNLGHGGHAGPMARSDDAGLTWTRIDDSLTNANGLTDICVVARCADKNTELGLNWIEFQP